MLVDEFMPVYDVSDAVATVVEADLATTWAALMEVDLIEVGRKRPLVAVLGALRVLPDVVSHLLHGELPPRQPEHLRLRDLTAIPLDKGGWVLPGLREQDEIALGLVGTLWRPVIEFARISSAAEFRDFAEPRFAKTIYALSVRTLDSRRTLLSGVMRTATTDEPARRWFRRYWTFGIGSGAHLLVNGLLDVTREIAELTVTVPLLLIGRTRADARSARGLLLWLGVTGYAAYIRRGLAAFPGELPVWGMLLIFTTAATAVLILSVSESR
jgi:hypothetical protein